MSLFSLLKIHTRGVLKFLAAITIFSMPLVATAAQSIQPIHLESGTQKNTLVELYTSQGCSSCPPAERWLGKLQDDPRLWNQIIPVAFHVDYWDYIGWKDQFAKPDFSKRQQRYHKERGIKSVYTPGFVINGKEWRSWFGLRQLPVDHEDSGQLTVDLDGYNLEAHFAPGSVVGKNRAQNLNVAIVGVGLKASVTRGENSGKELSQDFVVLEHLYKQSRIKNWKIELPKVTVPDGTRMALVAWVSDSANLSPIQSVGGWIGD